MLRSRGRTRRAALAVVSIAGLLVVAASSLASDGKSLYAACAPCHGARGEGVAATGAPNIAGLAAWYLERQLVNFKSGLRGRQPGDTYGAAMANAPALASDADRAAVSEYVAALAPAPAAAAPGNTNGRNYFNAICSACHGSNGLGNRALGAPRLAGISPAYLARQLAAFKSGRRGAQAGDKLGAQMRAITAMMPDARTEQDVIAYAAGLKP